MMTPAFGGAFKVGREHGDDAGHWCGVSDGRAVKPCYLGTHRCR